ncbi:hypothetical protein J6TS2_11880 [Heyndrickxia sporothermodurans]|nr:hypothetical protein J6TS2_11880 [Heyndrickxia sporothermodurans]
MTGINVLNSFSFEELLLISNKWRCIIKNMDDNDLNKLDYEYIKDELSINIEKLSIILKNISLNKTEYILLWEGI